MRARRNKRNHKKKSIKTLKIIFTLIIVFALISFIKNIHDKNNIQKPETNISSTIENNDVLNNSTEENDIASNQTGEIPVEKPITNKDITFSMAVTGDIMCHNTMYNDAYNSSKDTYDFSYMFEDVKYHLQTPDITVGNLETTFAGSKVGYSSYPTFNTPEILARNLKKAGFDVVSTANNHCLDKGFNGITSTIKYLDAADLAHTGTYKSQEDSEKILIKNVKGVKIAFLSFTYGTNGIPISKGKEYCVNLYDKKTITKQLDLAQKEDPDIICVSMHWGVEYQTIPNSKQKELADFLFKNGADIILGNHPHVPQSMERKTIKLDDGTTKQGFVIYSLGNFMADQGKPYTRDTAILKLQITKNAQDGSISINQATYTPIYIYKNKNKSKKSFKLIDIEKTIESYEAGYDTSIGKSTYNTLKTELKNIKKIIGKEIK